MKIASSNSELKKAVGIKAVELIKNGMQVGIGTGSTVVFFIEELGKRVRQGLQIQGVPTSFQSRMLCIENGIPILDVSNVDHIEIAIDGADEIDRSLNAIKGGGAAHTNEKIIASMADEFVIIADESKLVNHLCNKFPLPVEIVPSGLSFAQKKIRDLGANPSIRMAVKKDGPVITDNGNFVLDIVFDSIPEDLFLLDTQLKHIPGVLETGLFLGLSKKALIGMSGEVIVLAPENLG